MAMAAGRPASNDDDGGSGRATPTARASPRCPDDGTGGLGGTGDIEAVAFCWFIAAVIITSRRLQQSSLAAVAAG
ncbi:hypothetical protein, partial [Bifidobacterium sp. UBA744]|uniref:hypothetical protein n=1 Tax=Bifidobacterium sp. UBA744 TaxID=1946112 RepID=UPI0025C10CEB